ncbi:acyloxyacyl hydrolase [Hymenobacter jeollabukensis]|uniref:Acyloxyacyl hydrolase n=1 Tax=Hymenobacter jeollabukensis TaxID=2025313 RepID=A0A5R8WVW7_9BACT|nr:acyloxyacyl hydrolase [Hymenobacter jeollabukensis]TLM95575.1 acyloxyacyl hydrolase [Hymenobacter jeollabukensis]
MSLSTRLFLSLALGLGAAAGLRAQDVTPPVAAATPEPLVLGLYAQGGFIIAHSPRVKHLVTAHPTGLELNLQRQLTGRAPWHAWYRYPKAGLALVYYDYHNPVLQHSFAASVYLSKTFWRTQRQDLSFRLGTGVGYFPFPFDQQTNHKNTFVSSHLNATIQARLEYDVALTPKLGLLLGVALNHYSNGATAKPNLGINIPTVLLGLNYHQQRHFTPAPLDPVADQPADLGRTFWNLSTSAGLKQRNESDHTNYWVNSVTVAAGRRVNRKSNLLVGLEGFYDRSLLAEQRDTARAGDKLPDVKKAGVFIGHELLFGRLAFDTHLGFYLYNPYKSNKFYYERVGLKYHFTEHLFGAIDLKVHRGAADVLEWKVGVKL